MAIFQTLGKDPMKPLLIALLVTLIWQGEVYAGERLFSNVEIFVNNHTIGESNGAKAVLNKTGEIKCGHGKEISTTTWKFLRSENGADIYEFSRVVPHKSAMSAGEPMQVIYKGAKQVLWKDALQTILLQPK